MCIRDRLTTNRTQLNANQTALQGNRAGLAQTLEDLTATQTTLRAILAGLPTDPSVPLPPGTPTRAEPVSYTHLDVYKKQAVTKCPRSSIGAVTEVGDGPQHLLGRFLRDPRPLLAAEDQRDCRLRHSCRPCRCV